MIGIINLKLNYIKWHYTWGIYDLILFWRNILWFISNFFSIPILLRNLFAPWRAIKDKRTTTAFVLSDILSTLTINIIMRFVGFLIRFIFLIIGISLFVIVGISGPILIIIWLLLPFLIFALFIGGLALIIL